MSAANVFDGPFGVWDYQHDSEWRRLQASDVAQGKRIAALLDDLANVTAQRDQYARAMDGLAKQVADAGDMRHKRDADRRLAILANLAPHLASVTPGHGPERDALLEALAEVAACAERPAHVQAWHAAYVEWEGRRKP